MSAFRLGRASLFFFAVNSMFASASTLRVEVKATPEVRQHYETLVNGKRYQDAIAFVCQAFDLRCGGARIRAVNRDDQSGFAHTGLDRIIRIYPHAFHHPDSEVPHPGWLAAIIGHELIHLRQGFTASIYAQVERIYHGHAEYAAARELEAWQYMLDHARAFGLTCTMYLKIEYSREYYEWIIQHGGATPPDESIPADWKKYDRLQRECAQWNPS